MNNNDILKKFIRERKAANPDGFYGSISATEIASASRANLDEWLEPDGFNGDSIIEAFREAENETGHTSQATRPFPYQPQSTPVDNDALKMAFATLQAAFTPQSSQPPSPAIDVEALKAELKEELRKELGLQPLRVEVVTPQKTVVDCGMQHHLFPDLLMLVSCRIHAYLAGPAASFKTSAARQVAKALDLDFRYEPIANQTGAHVFLGFKDANGNCTRTNFRDAYEFGGVMLVDEFDNGNANTLAVINGMIDAELGAFPDGMVPRHKDFILVATGNTVGTGASASYVGRNPLCGSTLDRFAVIEWDYDAALEKAIAGNDEWTATVQGIRAQAAIVGSRAIISPRATFGGAKLLAAGMSKDKVKKYLIQKGMNDMEWSKIHG